MGDDPLRRMRALRKTATAMNATLASDLRPFLNPHDRSTFFRVPSQPPAPGEPNVTPTCTAFMALALTRGWTGFYKGAAPDLAKRELTRLLAAEWATAMLDANNAFTTAVVLRAAGMMFHHGVLSKADLISLVRTHEDPAGADYRKFKGKTLPLIAAQVAAHIPVPAVFVVPKSMARGGTVISTVELFAQARTCGLLRVILCEWFKKLRMRLSVVYWEYPILLSKNA